MVYISKAGPDNGFFSIEEGKKLAPCDQAFSQTIEPLQGRYPSTPQIGIGLNVLDCNTKRGDNIRVAASTDKKTASSFEVRVETWSVATLNSVLATWVEARDGAKDTQMGQWGTDRSSSYKGQSTQIKFPTAFKEPPEIVLWFRYLDLKPNGGQYRLHTYASDVTSEGFTCHIETWNVSEFYRVGVTWVASRKGRRGVETGRFVDSKEAIGRMAQKDRRIEFPKGKFTKPPTVLSGLSMLDNSAEQQLKLASVVSDVSASGFTWNMETDSRWQTSADFIAIG
ncbi:hypothetical protein LTR36_010451 [Oleoguttula mirabilis]|uniref:H-type lectin domain-containing protein n=1 Tax=Oleoguttula mirabilis TaxID=1507867 RepID=A0AAV9J453_9PEZI|nr:hypothetical protein LTR36_010451 [Oleoguttula mirabilis]